MLIGGQRDKVCRQLPGRSTTGDLTDAKGIEFRNFANCGLSRIDQKIINPTGSQNTESVCEQGALLGRLLCTRSHADFDSQKFFADHT